MSQQAPDNSDQPPGPSRYFGPDAPKVGGRRLIPAVEFVAEAKRRFGEDPVKWTLVCPACGTRQSPETFYATGKFVPRSGELNTVFGFSCIGRVTGQGDAGIDAKNKGQPWDKGCNWTLGGLLRIHEIEIIDDEGKPHPYFDLAPAPEGKPA